MAAVPSAVDRSSRHAQVAVPVPLRQAFTYLVPPTFASHIDIGSRVAVPFGRRKLAGYVVGFGDASIDEAKLKEIGGLLDDEPLFSVELLRFLKEAADYYIHPLGEVLRAASPPLPSDAFKALRARGFLRRGEALPGSRAATHRTLVLTLSRTGEVPSEQRLGRNQQTLLALLRERGELTLDELRHHIRSPRSTIRALERRGIIDVAERKVQGDRFFSSRVAEQSAPDPNQAQAAAIEAVLARLGRGGSFLLHGVTGSGKTEVYLRVIGEALRRGRGALMLVPEIALTPQLVARFRARFGDAIAVLHSELTAKQRAQAWQALRRGEVNLAIGARSALFAPVRELGVVVVDEEHDSSFKQEDGFRYQARDMALLRAHRAGAVCVLGSATPSLESMNLVERDKLTYLALPDRATPQPLPRVEVVDLGRHRSGPGHHPFLTGPLHQALADCLEAGSQAILFLNRRGFAPSVRCTTCNAIAQCPACSVSLTEHRGAGVLRCHYCDFTTAQNSACVGCGAATLQQLGVGTEQVEQTLGVAFPQARVARLDRDIAAGEGVEAVLDRLRRHEIDILVGTQMVTKGHDVPGVTLVGVLIADQSLAFPDFRATERTFQLLAQVAGRAGRGQDPGRVILQTYQPGHFAVQCARTHDYDGFVRRELADRKELGYPPYSRLLAVRLDAGDAAQGRRAAEQLARLARGLVDVREGRVKLLGPAPCPIARLRGRYRFRLMLRAGDRAALRRVARALARRIDEGLSPARAVIDMDPVSML